MLEQPLAQGVGIGANALGPGENLPGLPGGIEHPLGLRQFDFARPGGTGVAADQFKGVDPADLEFVFKETDQDLAANGRRPGGIPGVVDLDSGVIPHRAGAFLKIAEAFQR